MLPVQRPPGLRAGQMPGATLLGADDRPLLFACNRAQVAPRPQVNLPSARLHPARI